MVFYFICDILISLPRRIHQPFSFRCIQAQWESGMERRDVNAARKREESHLESEARSSSALMRSVRMTKLEELYRRDREIYEEQLNKMGLAFNNSDF